ncbi:unnamed protein product [Lactuca saligna]|uniref:Phytocyanin domain-containing protein n=1 Tax=Lactuca saligna TaxID=75948 RepID=A0AA35ZA59_LACSI|nr:unnamed protein product [Lactuca saligna]
MVRMMLCLVLIMMMKGVMTEVYNVGDSDGWTTPVNTSYSKWASSKKFHVGDTLWFHYDPASHNVVQVNQMGYQLCNISKARVGVKTYETGNDSFRIKGPGHYYFICSFPGHCKAGQKLDVRVLKKYPMTTTTTPKTIAMAPTSLANALYPITSLLFGDCKNLDMATAMMKIDGGSGGRRWMEKTVVVDYLICMNREVACIVLKGFN